jgi:diacylglycerol kinase (ATP)
MWLLVINRSSGRGKVDRKVKQFVNLCAQNGVPYQIVDQSSAKLTEEAIRSYLEDNQVEALIAFGGDGLVSLCLQLISKTQIGFCVIPTGTGNDFARSIGTHKSSIKQVFFTIYSIKPISIDLALAEGHNSKRYFVQVLSSGFDASVNELANQLSYPIGKLKYTIAMLIKLPNFKKIKYEISTDDQKLQIKSMLVAVANGSSYGGGMKILPNASYQDGELDLLYVDPVSKLTLLSIFPLVFKGWHLKNPAVHVLTTKKVELRGLTNAFADGEFVSTLPLKISVEKEALRTWICK